MPEFAGGPIVAGARTIKASDPTNLRAWLAQYEAAPGAAAYRARVVCRYDEGGAAAFALGRRTSAFDGSGRSTWAYDAYGRVSTETRRTDGRAYPTDYAYDALDRVRTLTYPDDGLHGREVLTHAYGVTHQLVSLTSSVAGTLLSGAEYNDLGLPTRYLLGAGATAEVRHTYHGVDPGAAGSPYGALKTIQLQQGTSAMLVDHDLAYDLVGNVVSLTDGANNETIAYGYDDLDRLTSASSPGQFGEGYAYDTVGNMTSKGGASLSYGDAAHKHAVTAYNGTAYAYDPNGNMTSRGGRTMQYDARNRLTKVTNGATESRFTCDADDRRTKRLDASGTIHYVGAFERNVGKGDGAVKVTKHYYAQLGPRTQLVAIRVVAGGASSLYYVGTDHLGSTARVADASFAPVERMRHLPFGGHRSSTAEPLTDRLFTGQTWDAVGGLYFYCARYYDPAIGRFCQPDTILPNYANPQSLNRYSYTLNNPLRYTDPTGHDPIDAAWEQRFRDAHEGRIPMTRIVASA